MEPDVANALARKARALLRRSPVGVLSTWSQTMPGYPFGSLAPFAMTHEGRPLLYGLAHEPGPPRDALLAMAHARDPRDIDDAVLLACDAEGFHLRSDGAVRWIAFDRPCQTANEVRAEMVRLTREARAAARS